MMNKWPKPIETYFHATNFPDPNAFLAIFAEDAIVIDEGKEYSGKASIKEWCDHQHFSTKLTIEIMHAKEINNETVVTAAVDGDFDKTGLPVPLLLDFHFILRDEFISQLTIVFTPNK